MDIPDEIKELPKLEAGQMTEYFQFLELHRIFFIDEVRKWIKLLDREEISMSKFVENFHVKLFNHKALSLASKEIEELKEENERFRSAFNRADDLMNSQMRALEKENERLEKEIERLKGLIWKAWVQAEDNVCLEHGMYDKDEFEDGERPVYKNKTQFKTENNL